MVCSIHSSRLATEETHNEITSPTTDTAAALRRPVTCSGGPKMKCGLLCRHVLDAKRLRPQSIRVPHVCLFKRNPMRQCSDLSRCFAQSAKIAHLQSQGGTLLLLSTEGNGLWPKH